MIELINGLQKPVMDFVEKKVPVIRPEGFHRILLEIYFLLIQLMQLYYIPMFVSFDEISKYAQENSLFRIAFHDLAYYSFVMELILDFFTGYYQG